MLDTFRFMVERLERYIFIDNAICAEAQLVIFSEAYFYPKYYIRMKILFIDKNKTFVEILSFSKTSF